MPGIFVSSNALKFALQIFTAHVVVNVGVLLLILISSPSLLIISCPRCCVDPYVPSYVVRESVMLTIRELELTFAFPGPAWYAMLKKFPFVSIIFVGYSVPASPSSAALWHHIFLADLSQPANPNITTADQAVVVNGDQQTIRLHLLDGGQHQTSPADPNQYNISTFASTDIPIQTGIQDDPHLGRSDTPILALPLSELWRRGNDPSSEIPGKISRLYRIEFNRRFSYPFACLVLMLIGVPLGPDGAPRFAATAHVNPAGSVDGLYFDEDRATAIEGRMASPGRADEFVTTAVGARLLGLHIGQVVPMGFYGPAQASLPGFGTARVPPQRRIAMKLVGLVVFNNEVVEDDADRLPTNVLFTQR